MSQVQKRPELQAVVKRLSGYIPGKEAGKPDLILKSKAK